MVWGAWLGGRGTHLGLLSLSLSFCLVQRFSSSVLKTVLERERKIKGRKCFPGSDCLIRKKKKKKRLPRRGKNEPTFFLVPVSRTR
jgi:hypothetical protein